MTWRSLGDSNPCFRRERAICQITGYYSSHGAPLEPQSTSSFVAPMSPPILPLDWLPGPGEIFYPCFQRFNGAQGRN
jgi:hypothetical protein